MRLRIPKWASVTGALVTVAGLVIQSAPQLQTFFPALLESKTAMDVLAVAGLILSLWGTPPHANTPSGGVLKPGEPPVDHPVT